MLLLTAKMFISRVLWSILNGKASIRGSISVYPTQMVPQDVKDTIIDYTARIGELPLGLYNISLSLIRNRVYIA